jgi:hypothetical protein
LAVNAFPAAGNRAGSHHGLTDNGSETHRFQTVM